MQWSENISENPLISTLPDGYLLRNFQNKDNKSYINLMKSAGFNDWNNETLDSALKKVIPNALFFIEHIETTEIVGTAMGSVNPSKYFPNGVELGWVAVAPSHRGKNLSYTACAAVIKKNLELGYREIYLLTDDFRLPAIKIYLKLGFIPYYYLPDMQLRWKEIFKKLDIKETIFNPN
ncbi:MAG: hypothetical protein DRI44_06030 [Chlamydiae bacterium]|nr:MAG: hypothetical protein DRI44_06030 [Chlamydiota bacterium]